MRRLLRSMSAALVLVLCLSAVSMLSAQERHPKIRAAINALKDARMEMRNAKDEFCGHKADAIKATDYAITQLQEALRYDRAGLIQNDLNKASYVKVSLSSEPYQRFPRIRAALDSLKAARDEMQNAAHDFGGHKQKALEATNDAITQLQLAIDCAK
ncbi:MAG TPA: hypothetical protein VFC63_01585 [Blastocatellia bacterium]|nr:hypothetical protein [Blastocatellia bacterium]